MAGEVEFAPTQADWVAANALWMRRSSYSRGVRWLALALLALAAADIGLRLWVGDSLTRGVTDSSLLLLFASALLGLPFFQSTVPAAFGPAHVPAAPEYGRADDRLVG